MPEITRAMSFHSKNVWFRHYFKPKIEFIFKKISYEIFTLSVAIDYFTMKNQKFKKKENDK
jgi:hypothetical protein